MEFFNLLVSLFSDFINFLDSFIIFGNLSFFKILIIIFLFSVALKFLFNHKGE